LVTNDLNCIINPLKQTLLFYITRWVEPKLASVRESVNTFLRSE